MSRLLDMLWPARGNQTPGSRSVVAVPDIPYAGERSDPKQHLDLFHPSQPEGAPLVMFVHGGAWETQDRRYLRAWLGLYGNVGRALAHRGIVTAVAGYRQADGRRSIADLRRALDTLRAQGERLDAARDAVVLVGHSAGAHLVAWLAHELGPPVRGVVAMAGYYDPHRFAPALGRRGDRLRAIFDAEPSTWSVLDRLGPSSPPMLAMIAQRDPKPLREAHAELRRAAQEAGARVEACEVPAMGHMGLVLSIGRQLDEVSERVARFVHDCCVSARGRRAG